EVCRLLHAGNATVLESTSKQAVRQGASVALPPGTSLGLAGDRQVAVEGSVAPIHDGEGNFTGLVVALRDITARKQMERLQRQNDEQMRYAQKMEAVSRLAGGVAHEFNNLLTAILGNTSLVMAGLSKDDPNQPQVAQIETATLRAAEVVRQLLA